MIGAVSTDSGAADFVTNDQTLSFSGTATANSAISLVVAGQTLTATADGSGNWTTTTSTTIADGTYSAVVTATDPAGDGCA